jgi:hypothetical protein
MKIFEHQRATEILGVDVYACLTHETEIVYGQLHSASCRSFGVFNSRPAV